MFSFWTASPTKKRRLEAAGDMARGDHDDNIDIQISEPMEINDNLEMDAVEKVKPG